MPKPIDPNMASPDTDVDVVQAYKLHSEQGIEALMAITQGFLRGAQGKRRRDTVGRLLDQLERLDADYRRIASELAKKDEFPNRTERWPGLFRLDEGATDA